MLRLRHFRANTPLYGLFVFACLTVTTGILFMGFLDNQFFIAFPWGTLTLSNKGWSYAHWPEMGMWSFAELMGIVLPMFLYCIMHIQRPYIKNLFGRLVYDLIQVSMIVIAILFSLFQYKLVLPNFPPSVLLVSLNVMYFPVILILRSILLCKQTQAEHVTFVFELQ